MKQGSSCKIFSLLVYRFSGLPITLICQSAGQNSRALCVLRIAI